MRIRLRSTGAVMFDDELRAYMRANNGPSWDRTTPEVLEALGADVVFEGAQATPRDPYQVSTYAGVEQSGGKWYTKYVLGPIFTDRPATATEPSQTAAQQMAAYKATKDAEQAKSVRTERNRRLTECDWTQLVDSTADKVKWTAYRQALRDLPTQAGFPWTVVWPKQPG